MNIRKIIFLLFFSFTAITVAAQKIAVSNNLLYDATSTFNLGFEFKTGDRTTLLIPAGYNPWTFSDNRKLKHFLVQPELRFWKCEPYSGHFWGIHAHYAFYNAGGVGPLKALKDYRYEGWLAGGGLTYGYNWVLSSRWSFEASIGVGYAYLSHDKYPYKKCEAMIGNRNIHYFGPTKIGLSFVYLIK